MQVIARTLELQDGNGGYRSAIDDDNEGTATNAGLALQVRIGETDGVFTFWGVCEALFALCCGAVCVCVLLLLLLLSL